MTGSYFAKGDVLYEFTCGRYREFTGEEQWELCEEFRDEAGEG